MLSARVRMEGGRCVRSCGGCLTELLTSRVSAPPLHHLPSSVWTTRIWNLLLTMESDIPTNPTPTVIGKKRIPVWFEHSCVWWDLGKADGCRKLAVPAGNPRYCAQKIYMHLEVYCILRMLNGIWLSGQMRWQTALLKVRRFSSSSWHLHHFWHVYRCGSMGKECIFFEVPKDPTAEYASNRFTMN